jgi:hypothetical protein
VDLMAGPAGVISSVEELARHSVWSPLYSTDVLNRPFGRECF